MITGTPFTRNLAFFLVLVMLRSSVCGAASLVPGSLAVLDGPLSGPEMGAAWEQAFRDTYLDPHFLVMGEDEVALILDQWGKEGEAVKTAWDIADSAALRRVKSLMEDAWVAYYAFSFQKAQNFLNEAEELLLTPGDSRFRSRIGFEAAVLKGMIGRAVGERSFSEAFMRAAAIDPEAELSPDRYSPEIISFYQRARGTLLEQDPTFVAIEGNPEDAVVLVDGKTTESTKGSRVPVFPGRHFIEAGAPGYEPFSRVLEIDAWESPSVPFNLRETGPEGDPVRFFLQRLEAGDRSYLSRLVGVLDVDYVLIPDGGKSDLRCWLVDREGHTVAHGTLWSPGEEPGAAAPRVAAILAPLGMELGDPGGPALSQMNLPPVSDTASGISEEAGQGSAWKRYAPVIGLLLLVGVATASGSGGGGTSIGVTW